LGCWQSERRAQTDALDSMINNKPLARHMLCVVHPGRKKGSPFCIQVNKQRPQNRHERVEERVRMPAFIAFGKTFSLNAMTPRAIIDSRPPGPTTVASRSSIKRAVFGVDAPAGLETLQKQINKHLEMYGYGAFVEPNTQLSSQ
jgi:hypothetical protein